VAVLLLGLPMVCVAQPATSASSQARAINTSMTPRVVTSIAHRGGIVPGFPENTLAAFGEAMRQGAHVIEIDLRGTKDGEVVVMHDATLDRTTNGHGRVVDHTLAQLKRLDAGRGERIPTYEEVLQLVAGTDALLLLDIKEGPGLDKRKVVEITRQHDAMERVIVGPRNLADLRAFRELDAGLRTLGFIDELDDLDAFVSAGVDMIRLWPEWVRERPALVERLHRQGKSVWITAGRAPRAELAALVDLGVDGILSDRPAVMHALLTADACGARHVH
jgi:glycerophosphoryl diester phosphodiesterase